MLNLTKCRMHKTQEFPIVPGFEVREEGLPLVKEFVDGKEHVKVFDGTNAANSTFIGFSYSENLTPVTATTGVKVTLDAAGKTTLQHKVVDNEQISVYAATTDVYGNVSSGARYATADVTVVDNEVTVTGAADKFVEIVYTYEPTIQDLMQDSSLRLLIPSMSSSQMTRSTGVIMDGEVYTDKVDLSADFTQAGLKFALTTNGLLTCYTGDIAPTGSLAIASGVELMEYPTADSPTVGLRIVR